MCDRAWLKPIPTLAKPPFDDQQHKGVRMGKQCCSDKTCCESNRPATPYSSRTTPPPGLCIAVVSEDEESLVVFDAAGTPRRYHHRKGLNLRKLCFHVHSGMAKNDDDAMLSPCFDENGLHGEPDETCFCGVEDPHIHTHLREECRGLETSKHNKIPFARSVSQTPYPSDTICRKSIPTCVCFSQHAQ